MAVFQREWEQKPPNDSEPRPDSPTVTYSIISVAEGEEFEFDLSAVTYSGSPSIVYTSGLITHLDGTLVSGEMPEGEHKFFPIGIRVDG